MQALRCCGNTFAALSRAAARNAAARLRRLGIFAQSADWPRRAALCETCHLRILHRGIAYCGRPFLQQIDRIPAEDGCGCPIREKARSPEEHCPLTPQNRPVPANQSRCSCKWCNLPTASS